MIMSDHNYAKKLWLFGRGRELSRYFCKINNIPLPEYRSRRLRSTGLYSPQTSYTSAYIDVNMEQTALAVDKPGHMRWSHPGWKTDRTPFGVILHETGHHVEECLDSTLFIGWDKIRKGKKISGYEPNRHEAFAETMRLFIGNPDLLRLAIPKRYTYIVEVLKLKPAVTVDYKTAIGNPAYFSAADRWTGKEETT